MEIIISHYAKQQIRLIFTYHLEVASYSVAKKIVDEFVKTFQLLSRLPEAGQVYMVHHGKEYRRMICGNYKIIYHINVSEIHVSDVFDSRQDPEKQNP